jgi:hypothetical protein
VVAVGAVVAWLLVALRGRAGGDAQVPGAPPRPASAVDHFAEADRLAGRADYTGAVRALAAAVAVRLGGEEAWDSSPLTVKELFRRSDRPEQLRPLLLAFEGAAYAGRPAGERDYQAASAAARLYRAPEARAA